MTIFGKHTVRETVDLINDTQWRIDNLQSALDKATDISKDPSLRDDWKTFLSRWQSAKLKAKAILTAAGYIGTVTMTPLASPDVMPAEDIYQDIMRAINAQYPGAYTDHDLAGLQIRIENVAASPIVWTPRPEGKAVDIDLGAYAQANKGTTAVIDAKNAAQAKTEDWIADNWGKLLVGGVATIGTLVALKKIGVL